MTQAIPPANSFPALLRALSEKMADFIWPVSCPKCAAPTLAKNMLCPACWRDMKYITSPRCTCCGLPFEFDAGENMVCGQCAGRAPYFKRARSLLVYDDASRDILLRFKHADQTDLAPVFAKWMMQAGSDLLSECDLLVPVPLHWTRLFYRRYNQSAMLALLISKLSGIAVQPDLLIRQKRTPSQGHFSKRQRQKNVQGAFVVHPRLKKNVSGKKILLIDDVYTTGATVNACARTLRASGAATVDVLTLSRVCYGGSLTSFETF